MTTQLEKLQALALQIYNESNLNDYSNHATTNIIRSLLRYIEVKTDYKFDINFDGFDGEVLMFIFDIMFRVNDIEQFIMSKTQDME